MLQARVIQSFASLAWECSCGWALKLPRRAGCTQTCKLRGLKEENSAPFSSLLPFHHSFVRERERERGRERVMEEIRSSPPPTAASTTKREQEMSAMSRLKKDCIWFAVSVQEGFSYVKAFFCGLVRISLSSFIRFFSLTMFTITIMYLLLTP